MIRLLRILSFFAFYLVEIVRSNFKVARDVLSPNQSLQPSIVAVPLDPMSDFGVSLLANLISMTPGTLCLDYDPVSHLLYIHSMYPGSDEAFAQSIKQNYERRIQAILRG